MKDKKLSYLLRDYSLAASAIFLARQEAQGQIVYHDFNPNELVSSNISIDLNSNGSYDLQFSQYNWTHSNGGYDNSWELYSWEGHVSVKGIGEGALAATAFGNQLTKLNQGQVIDGSLSWCHCDVLLAHQYGHYGPYFTSHDGYWFEQTTPTYFGFRIKVEDDKFYGWMRMTVFSTYATLYDYAYNTIPNQPILAGDNGCGLISTIEVMNADTMCIGDTVLLKAHPTNGYSFNWKKPGSGVFVGNDSVLQVPSGTADYYVVVSDPGSCFDTSAIQHVAHINPVVPSVYQQNDTLFSNQPNVFQWYLDGTAIPGATDYFYVPTINGIYTVTTHIDGCYASSSNFLYAAVETGSGPQTDDYPKISIESSYVSIQTSPVQGEKTHISIVDELGRYRYESVSEQSTLIISTGNLEAGVYFLILQTNQKQTVLRFIKN